MAAGDEVEPVSRDPRRVSVADITRLYAHNPGGLETMPRAAALEAPPEDWRRWFAERVAAGAGSLARDTSEAPQFG